VYDARLLAAGMADALGNPDRAAQLRKQAEDLRCAFEEQFWCEDIGTYAIALDGRKQPCRVRSSNPGHALYGGIADRERGRRVAFVPQETHVVFPFSVNQMVLMGRAPHQSASLFDSGIDVERAEYAMRLTDTLDLAKKAFTQLSGGERQRVVLASALAQDPEVLLLDEPTVYLDLKHQIHFYDIVERLNLEHRMTIVSVTHDVNLAARYARRMIAMRAGRFVADGVPESVLTPEHLYEIFEVSVAVFKRTDGRGSYIIPA
jgi:iron complex transport system ATP-binding protein